MSTNKRDRGLYQIGDRVRVDGESYTILVVDRTNRQFGILTDSKPMRFLVTPMHTAWLIDGGEVA